MFLQACVCPQGGRGVCLSACCDTPPGSRPPHPGTGRHPPRTNRPLPPGTDTPPPGPGRPPPGKQTPADGLRAASTHPTGMHSCYIWWLDRDTIIIFGGLLESPWLLLAFWPKILGGDRDLRMVLLSFYECRFSGGDTMRWWGHSNPTLCKRICLNFCTRRQWDEKTSDMGTHTIAHAEVTWWNLYYLNFFLLVICLIHLFWTI